MAVKLAQSLRQPFSVAGNDVAVAVSVGVALDPEHGKDAECLLRRAVGQAAGMTSVGRAGFARRTERGLAAAPNDDAAID